MDLDKSGFGFQRVRTYLGPSLGWVEELVQASTEINTGGIHIVLPGESVLLVNAAAPVQINLPDVREWFQQKAYQPATGFERSITIKDIGGNAANFNIVVVPYGQQGIDDLQQSLIISEARANVKFIPLVDMSGWMVETAIGSGGGGGGGGDVFKAGNNTFTGVNNFQNIVSAPTVASSDNSQNVATTGFVKGLGYIDSSALVTYAPLFSPAFSGTPTAPTPTPAGDNSLRLATTAFVQSAVATVGGGAPISAPFVTFTTDGTLSAERVLTNSATITWDLTVAGQVKANTSVGGGNVSNSGLPVNGQMARWVTQTTIEGIDPATVLTAIGAQPADGTLTGFAALNGTTGDVPYFSAPDTFALQGSNSYGRALLAQANAGAVRTYIQAQALDGDLTALAALTGTNTIYYRSATDVWSPVTFSGLTFSGGVLTSSGSGNVSTSGTITPALIARWASTTTIESVTLATAGIAPVAAPAFTGNATSTTPATSDNSTSIATTAFVKNQGYAVTVSPTFTGTPIAPTAPAGTSTTQIATTAFVAVSYAPLASPALTGSPTSTTVAKTDTSTIIATTAYVKSVVADFLPVAGGSTLTGGFYLTPYNGGTVSSGTFTPNAGLGNYQYYTNGGAHTLAAPTADCAIDVQITNSATAGTITFTGYTVGANVGDPLTTTSGHRFIISIRRINSISSYSIRALQ